MAGEPEDNEDSAEAAIGYRIAERTVGTATADLSFQRRHSNTHGGLHGGIIATLLDAVGSQAGALTPDGALRKVITISLTVNFLSSVNSGKVTAVGQKIGGGRKLFSSVGKLTGETGETIAISQSVHRYISD